MRARIVAISDRSVASAELVLERFAELARLARPRSVVLQLRDLELSAQERFLFGRALLEVARAHEQLMVVNERVDLAVLLGADGVHLGESAIETSDARRLLGSTALVMRASHDPERAVALDADGVLLAPIAESHKGRPALGLEALRWARALPEPGARPALFALGGVTSENASACLGAGADGVAMIGGVLAAGAPRALVRALGIER